MSRKCKSCGVPFTPVRPMQKVCSPVCAMKVARQVVDKAERKETKLKLDAMQTKPNWSRKPKQLSTLISGREMWESLA
jgi:hypothetical protein